MLNIKPGSKKREVITAVLAADPHWTLAAQRPEPKCNSGAKHLPMLFPYSSDSALSTSL